MFTPRTNYIVSILFNAGEHAIGIEITYMYAVYTILTRVELQKGTFLSFVIAS